MVRPRRQIKLYHGYPHQTLTFILQPAKLPCLSDADIRHAMLDEPLLKKRRVWISLAACTRWEIAVESCSARQAYPFTAPVLVVNLNSRRPGYSPGERHPLRIPQQIVY